MADDESRLQDSFADDLPDFKTLHHAVERIKQPGAEFNVYNLIQLADQILLLAEHQKDNRAVSGLGIELLQHIISRRANLGEAYLRMAKFAYIEGDFTLARSHLKEAKLNVTGADQRLVGDIDNFEAELNKTVIREGQSAFLILSAVAAGVILWFLATRKRS